MPLLYGESRTAFTRLQHTIIAQSNDQSIFAWTSDNDDMQGVLAQSPSNFANSGDIRQIRGPPLSSPYRITNAGLEFYARAVLREDRGILALECFRQSPQNPWQLPVAIKLRKTTVASFRHNATNLPTISHWDLVLCRLFGARDQKYYLGLNYHRRASKQHVPWHRSFTREQHLIMPIILVGGLIITAGAVPRFAMFIHWIAALTVLMVATERNGLACPRVKDGSLPSLF